jgi:preprotein translocase subunit SecE
MRLLKDVGMVIVVTTVMAVAVFLITVLIIGIVRILLFV